MTDSTGTSLADLLEVGPTEAGLFDWDISALADWPNIVPDMTPDNHPAPNSSAELPATGFCRAY